MALNRTIRIQNKELEKLKEQTKQLTAEAVQADTELSKQVYETGLLSIELDNVRKSLPLPGQSK